MSIRGWVLLGSGACVVALLVFALGNDTPPRAEPPVAPPPVAEAPGESAPPPVRTEVPAEPPAAPAIAVAGVVRAVDGEAVAGARVALRESAPEAVPVAAGAWTEAAVTGADGRYRAAARDGAHYDVRVAASGFVTRTLRAVRAPATLDVELAASVAREVLVVDEQEIPVAGARIEAIGVDKRYRYRGDARTDGAGRARLADAPPGVACLLLVDHAGFAPLRQLVSADDVRVTCVLKRGRPLHGRVVDEGAGGPLADARVGPDWRPAAAVATDADGRYELAHWRAEPSDVVTAERTGFANAEETVGPRTQVDFALAPLCVVRGRLLEPDGRPAAGAAVHAVTLSSFAPDATFAARGAAVCDEAGRFEVRGGGDGRPGVLVCAGRRGRLRGVFGPDGAVRGVLDLGDVRLRAAAAVSIVVTTTSARPLAGLQVTLDGPPLVPLNDVAAIRAPWGGQRRRYLDADGCAAFPHVEVGDYTVTLAGARGPLRHDEVAIEGAQTIRIELEAPPQRRTLQARVATRDGRTVILDAGARHGVKAGDRFRSGDAVIVVVSVDADRCVGWLEVEGDLAPDDVAARD